MPILKRCPDCKRYLEGGRCPAGCTTIRERRYLQAKREQRPRIAAEDARRAEAVRAHVEQFGFVCPGWQRPEHPATDLTADHPHAVAAGGDERQALAVLCRSCNSAKRHRA